MYVAFGVLILFVVGCAWLMRLSIQKEKKIADANSSIVEKLDEEDELMIKDGTILSMWSEAFTVFFAMASNDEKNGIKLNISPLQDIEPNELA